MPGPDTVAGPEIQPLLPPRDTFETHPIAWTAFFLTGRLGPAGLEPATRGL